MRSYSQAVSLTGGLTTPVTPDRRGQEGAKPEGEALIYKVPVKVMSFEW